jgi:1-deoxy-D-xylulose-5-phosphate synthase
MSGLGSIFNSFAVKHGFTNKILNFGIGDNFVQHGKNQDLLKEIGLDAENIASQILMHFELQKEMIQV